MNSAMQGLLCPLNKALGSIGPPWYHTGESGHSGEDGQLRFDEICSLAHPTLLLWLSISGSVEQHAGPANVQSGTDVQYLHTGRASTRSRVGANRK
jgi:hypothetical protein